ncbi:MAG: hypothetical protein J0M25_11525 [Flavobacteriales bacterium]|nr:hypothetical protein [Flavobacteriales bacterium]
MKKILLLVLFFSIVSKAQTEKYKTADYALPTNVKGYHTFIYVYDVALGKFKTVEKKLLFFENGLLKTDFVMDNYLGLYAKLRTYEYNDQKQLIAIKEASDYQNPKYYLSKEFFYTQNQLTKVINYGGSKKIIKELTYDKSGKVIQSKTIDEDNVLIEEVRYNYTTPSDYTVITKIFSNGKEISLIEDKYMKNLLISKKINDSLGKILYQYEYDSKGNQILLDDGLDEYHTNYSYGQTGAILKSRATEYDEFEDSLSNFFKFSEITFTDGTKEGSKNFDVAFVKSFNMSVLSYDVIDDLN